MAESPKPVIIRDLQNIEDLEQAEALEKEVWVLADRDVMPLALMIATREAGSVWVNAYRLVSYLAPFGGVKASGIGRENGIRAVYEYLEAKSVFINPTPGVDNPFVLG